MVKLNAEINLCHIIRHSICRPSSSRSRQKQESVPFAALRAPSISVRRHWAPVPEQLFPDIYEPWERVVSHLHLQSIAEKYGSGDLYSCDHMRFTSPLSYVTPSPRAETRSKHPPRLPCASRQCFCYCRTAWPSPWASTNCASPWWARTRARFGSSTPASRKPRPWKTTCELKLTLPESPVGIPRKGFALWWVHIRTSFIFKLKTRAQSTSFADYFLKYRK